MSQVYSITDNVSNTTTFTCAGCRYSEQIYYDNPFKDIIKRSFIQKHENCVSIDEDIIGVIIKKLKDALEKYADEKSWRALHPMDYPATTGYKWIGYGLGPEIARNVLEETK